MIRSLEGKTPKIHPSCFVSETAYIVGDVEIGEDTSIWPGAVIRGDYGKIIIGKACSIQDNCVLHTDDYLELGESPQHRTNDNNDSPSIRNNAQGPTGRPPSDSS